MSFSLVSLIIWTESQDRLKRNQLLNCTVTLTVAIESRDTERSSSLSVGSNRKSAAESAAGCEPNPVESTDLDSVVDEAPAVPRWPQVRVLFSAGHLDSPHRLPGLIQLGVDRVDPGVVRSHCVAHICWDSMLLQRAAKPKRLSAPPQKNNV